MKKIIFSVVIILACIISTIINSQENVIIPKNKPFLNETNSQSIKSKSRYETSRELVHFLNKV